MNIPDDPIGDALLALLAQTVAPARPEQVPIKTPTPAIRLRAPEAKPSERRVPVHGGERALK